MKIRNFKAKHMRNIKKYFIFIIIIAFSCKKEIITNNDSKFFIGDSTSSDILFYKLDTIIGKSLGGSMSYQLDIDKDNLHDITFNSEYNYSPGGVVNKFSKMTVQNTNLSIIGANLIDTIINCTYKISDSTTQSIIFNSLSDYKCSEGNDSIMEIKKLVVPFFLTINDNIDNEFISANEFLLSKKISTINYLIWEGNKFKGYSRTNIKQGFNDIGYIVFKIYNINNKDKLGWIKLRIKDFNLIELIEYAIQK